MQRRDRPILFSAPMVRAIREKRKTQTRRIVKDLRITGPNPPNASTFDVYNKVDQWVGAFGRDGHGNATSLCPYGKPGDRLWVRETWAPFEYDYEGVKPSELPRCQIVYFADQTRKLSGDRWRPSIFMPRWASRITLEITDVRVERLQDISEEDAKAEGIWYHDGLGVGHSGWRYDRESDVYKTACEAYFALWVKINGLESLKANPWVWVVSPRDISAEVRNAA